ncbi:MAG: radical SAM family heme chaperone HemW [Candidatus Rokubacteria bacterium]|nr:radical SAM family heme chaperone HemW [Candidatus Rokubacteria bacterium]
MLADRRPVTASLGAYIHAPFCAKRCGYCAFNTAPWEPAAMARYVRAVMREMDLAGTVAWTPDVPVHSIFLGGGTPSLLAADDMSAILDRLRRRFRVLHDAEITVECNPESVTRVKLEAYRRAGVNRISLGVQAVDDQVLERLGRLHGAAAARAAFDAAREAGFGNVSVDLMYGLPGVERDDWRHGVETVLAWAPEHLSAYGLSLDPGSLWGASGVDGLPAEDAVVAQYWTLVSMARDHGFEHYEVSNYARPGYRSRHNLTYWRRGEYLAFGPGAAGFVADVRWANVKPVPRYCSETEAGRLPVDTCERLTDRQALAERLILGLRVADGVPASWLEERATGDGQLRTRIDWWQARGLLVFDNDRVRLTEEGYLLSDALFIDLL